LSGFRNNIKDEDIEISDKDFEGLRDRGGGREVDLSG